MSRTKTILLLAAVTFLTFGNSLTNELIGDAKTIFENNSFYHDPRNLSRLFQKNFIQSSDQMLESPSQEISFSGCISYRPVTALSFFLDYFLWRANAFGYHLNNVILHLAAAFLVFIFAQLLIGRTPVALLAALAFITHPLQSEVVNHNGYRSDILLAIFYMLSFILYIKAKDRKEGRLSLMIGSYVTFALALFSKEAAVLMPVMLLVYDYLFSERQSFSGVIRRQAKIYLGYLLIAAGYLVIYFFVIPSQFYPKFLFFGLNKAAHVIIAVKIFAHYLMAIIFPWTVTILPPLYAPPPLPVNYFSLFASLFFILFCLFFAIKRHRPEPVISFGIVWFFVNYLPVSNILPLPNPFAFRFLYLPSIGFFLILAILLQRLTGYFQQRGAAHAGIIMTIAVIGLYISLSMPLNAFFKNNIVTCTEMIRRYPESSRPFWVLGLSYLDRQEYDKAVYNFQEYLKRDVNNPFIPEARRDFLTYLMLGRCYVNDPDQAMPYFEKALALNSDFLVGYADLAKTLIKMRRFPEALNCARIAISRYEKFTIAYVFAIHSLAEMGRFPEAEALLARVRAFAAEDANVKYVADFLKAKQESP